jgi:hypothetical protein
MLPDIHLETAGKRVRISIEIANNPGGISNRYLKHKSTVLPLHKKNPAEYENLNPPEKRQAAFQKNAQVRNLASLYLCQQLQLFPEISAPVKTYPLIHNFQQDMGVNFFRGGGSLWTELTN